MSTIFIDTPQHVRSVGSKHKQIYTKPYKFPTILFCKLIEL